MVDNIVSSLGAGSGINVPQLVDDLVSAERAGSDLRLDTRQQKLDAQLSGYGVLRSAISNLQDTLELLKNADTFNAKTVAFPTTDVLTPVEIKPNALSGDFQVEVLEIAQAHSLTSASFSSASEAVGEGTLTFNFGSWDSGFTAFSLDPDSALQTITIDESNNTLTGLRDAINDADFGVQASIVADDGEFRLLITAPSGASNELEITVEEPAGSPTNNDADGSQLTANQSGEDARLKVNGFEVTRSSNQVDDVVEGLEFTLNKASVGEVVSFSISSDTSTAESSIRSLVEAYNEFQTTVKDLVTTSSDDDDEESNSGSLSTDPTAKSILNSVRALMGGTVTGVDSTFNALAFVGVKTELDGTLTIVEDDFEAALSDNYDRVTELFAPSASTTDSLIEVTRYKDGTAAGTFDVVITAQPSKGGFAADTIVNNGAAFDYVSGGAFSTTFAPSSPDYDFTIGVNGTSSEPLSLTGSFDSLIEVKDQLQALINGDTNLKGQGIAVDVTIVGDTLQFESRQYGTSSKVTFSNQGVGIDNLGFGVGQGAGSIGTDVAGTINGVAGFGSGNVLLPEFDSDLSGLSLRVTPGATTASITHSRGFGTELNNLLDDFIESSGLISNRETNINSSLESVEEDRETLDTRMAKRYSLMQAQFIQMEAILSALNSTSESLNGLVDRLPFTATNN